MVDRGVRLIGGREAAELSLCRRCATLEITLEQMEADMSAGKPTDPEMYARIASHLRRLLETLGIKRRPREIESNPLIDYFNHPSPPRAAEADDEDAALETAVSDALGGAQP